MKNKKVVGKVTGWMQEHLEESHGKVDRCEEWGRRLCRNVEYLWLNSKLETDLRHENSGMVSGSIDIVAEMLRAEELLGVCDKLF